MTGPDVEFFVKQFRALDNETLIVKYGSADLVPEAIKAIEQLALERGLPQETLRALRQTPDQISYQKAIYDGHCAFCSNKLNGKIVQAGLKQFCNETCWQSARQKEAAETLGEEQIMQHACAIQNSPCPVCGRNGSIVEYRKAHYIYSLAIFTNWSSKGRLSCHHCSIGKNIEALLICAVAGWWGIPWGIFMTPVQIVCNLIELFKKGRIGQPSPELLEIAQLYLGQQLLEQRGAEQAASPSPTPQWGW